jgi:3-oxoacyl-[acyl-carrier protein] reductase
MKLTGKCAVITGADKGLGYQIALAYLKEGADVAACSRTLESESELADIAKDLPGNLFQSACDITKPLEVSNFIKRVLFEFETIDILVNNASIYGKSQTLMEYEPALFSEVISTSINGSFNMIQAVAAPMKQQHYGKIISVTSSSMDLQNASGPYCIGKAGLECMSSILAMECANLNISSNTVDPTGCDFQQSCKIEGSPVALEHTLDLFVYLAGAESNGINGKNFIAREWKKS